MGNGTSISYEDNSPDYNIYKNINYKNDLLLFERCIYMTKDQYKSEFHIPNNIYVDKGIVSDIKSIDELSKFIINQIKNTAIKIGDLYKIKPHVPSPIFVMYARKKEYVNTIFGKCYEDVKNGVVNPNCDSSDDIETYKYIAENTKDDDELIKNSTLGIFEFTDNYQYYIYYPNLKKDLKYMTNYNSNFISNTSIKNMIKDGLLFNIIDVNVGYDKLRNDLYSVLITNNKFATPEYIKNTEDIINNSISVLKKYYSKKFSHLNDLNNICYTNGCISDYGEDFINMLPAKGKDEGSFKKNAEDKAPYFPTKCLKTFNYENNMFKVDDEYYKDVKKNVAKYIVDYKKNLEKIKTDKNFDVSNYSDTNLKLIEELNNGYINFRHKNSDANLNNKDVKYHYSKDYNNNILIELSKRYNSYPGITEYIFPIFKINTELISDIVMNLPWGDKLLTKNYLLIDDNNYPLYVNKHIYSFNNLYYMSLSITGIIYVYDIINSRVIYTLNDTIYSNVVYVKYENGTLNLYGKNDKNNDIVFLWKFTTIDMLKSSTKNPYSIIVEDNGDINVYGDKFELITNDELKNRIDKSKKMLIYNNNLDPLITSINDYNRLNKKSIYNLNYDRCTRILKDSLEMCDNLL